MSIIWPVVIFILAIIAMSATLSIPILLISDFVIKPLLNTKPMTFELAFVSAGFFVSGFLAILFLVERIKEDRK